MNTNGVLEWRSAAGIPKGFWNKAQGCEARATLGQPGQKPTTPTGLRHPHRSRRLNPVGVGIILTVISQGSSCPRLRFATAWHVATLGWRAKSLWDWPKRGPDLWVIQRAGRRFSFTPRQPRALSNFPSPSNLSTAQPKRRHVSAVQGRAPRYGGLRLDSTDNSEMRPLSRAVWEIPSAAPDKLLQPAHVFTAEDRISGRGQNGDRARQRFRSRRTGHRGRAHRQRSV